MLYQQIESNKLKTVFVVALYFALFVAIGAAVGYVAFSDYLTGIVTALIGGIIYSIIMLSQSTSVVMRLNNAREITEKSQAPQLFNIVSDMAMVAQVPMPKIYIINDASPNAFATGTKPTNAAVAVTTGLLDRLDREEVEGVIAHEFGHIRNYDIRLQTIAIAMGGLIAFLTQIGSRFLWFGGGRSRKSNDDKGGAGVILMVLSLILMMLGPLMATIMQLALSRNREYLADATAVEFTRNPQGLIDALTKISQAPPMKEANKECASLYIASPLKRGKDSDSWFSTHPSTANRIKRLQEM